METGIDNKKTETRTDYIRKETRTEIGKETRTDDRRTEKNEDENR
jgi:hypothetical protein